MHVFGVFCVIMYCVWFVCLVDSTMCVGKFLEKFLEVFTLCKNWNKEEK